MDTSRAEQAALALGAPRCRAAYAGNGPDILPRHLRAARPHV